MRTLGAILLLYLVTASDSIAYVQDRQLELEINNSDPKALAQLPAKRYKESGAAGFFQAHGLFVVPGTGRAWCQDSSRGVLPRGCYVEFYFQGKGLKHRRPDGSACGLLGRWHRAPGALRYEPTPGAHFSRAIANDDADVIEAELYEQTCQNQRVLTRH